MPAARIIGILREPATFLRALHLQLIRNHHETETDFRTAIGLDEDRREGRHIPDRSVWPSALIYSDRVRYVEQVRRYEALFPPEQLLFLIYDDYRKDNEGTLGRVLRFLDVDENVSIEPVEVHQAVRVRSLRVRSYVERLSVPRGPAGRLVKSTVKTIVPRQLRRDMKRKAIFAKPEPHRRGLHARLRRRFKPEVVALSEHIGRDLVEPWGYEDVD